MIRFTVYGQPRPQSRPRFYRRGNFVGTYDKDKDDKKNFAQVSSEYSPHKPFEGAVIVTIDFYLKRPKGHYGTGRNKDRLKPSAPTKHIKKPDIDNFGKLVIDALTGLFYVDDSQIIELNISKQYDNLDPRTEIKIEEL